MLRNWVITVAIAAPAGPILNPERKRISSATFKAVEITRKISGVTESP